MLAAITKVPEFGIKEIQAKALGEAIANVARHYDTAIDQKTLDWFNLFQVSALVYGPPLGKLAIRRRAARNQPQPEPENPAPFDPGGFKPSPVMVDPRYLNA